LIGQPGPFRIIIAWRYQSETGQPIAMEHKQMNQLEYLLEPVFSQNHFVILALVSTGEDLREWTYYAESEEGFMARLNFALDGTPAFPIEIHIASDSRWGMYEQFQAGVRERVN
jgi:Family of unknown function (DUF695)